MSWFQRRCKSIAPFYDYRCQRDANHVGAHTFNHHYSREMDVWFTCIECGISTIDPLRVCEHCRVFQPRPA